MVLQPRVVVIVPSVPICGSHGHRDRRLHHLRGGPCNCEQTASNVLDVHFPCQEFQGTIWDAVKGAGSAKARAPRSPRRHRFAQHWEVTSCLVLTPTPSASPRPLPTCIPCTSFTKPATKLTSAYHLELHKKSRKVGQVRPQSPNTSGSVLRFDSP